MNKRITSIFLTAMMTCTLFMQGLPVSAQEMQSREYDDIDEITNTGVDLTTTETLTIAKPAKPVSTTSGSYYISGTSNVQKELTLDGVPVEDRGRFGTFGAKVELQMGVNTFTLRNGNETETVTITREPVPDAAKTKRLTKAVPSFNDITYEGEYTLSCVAPSDGRVTARINGEEITLKQVAATAQSGVPAVYKGTVHLDGPSGSRENMGNVTYTLTFGGNTTEYTSAGDLTVIHQDARLPVEINNNATTIYEKNDSGSNFVAMLNKGAQDTITELDGDMARLSMGGWVYKRFLDLMDSDEEIFNDVRARTYEVNEDGEYLTIRGTASSTYKSYMNSEKVYIRFYNMAGLSSVPAGKSQLFDDVFVTTSGNDTILEFMRSSSNNLSGYDVRYDGEGNIDIFFNPMPELGPEDQPLSNLTIVIDAGHGGYDPGALGVLDVRGPNEKEFAMANAIAVQKRLESLGAHVVTTVPQDLPDDEKIELHDRMQITRDHEADMFISLHCNSVGGSANDLKPEGCEVYYYENLSHDLSEMVLNSFAQSTGRKLRGVYFSNYYVTRTTLCPSMLLEMGFMTNPVEYDNIRSRDGLFATANAIGDAVVAYLEKMNA